METIWIVLYRCRYEEGWKVEPKGVYADKRHAAMRLELETIDQPLWDHAVIEGQVPARTAKESAEQVPQR